MCRRLLTVLVVTTAMVTMLTTVSTSAAFAKTQNCGTSMSNKSNDTGDMDMGHSKSSMEKNCPLVAGAREIAVDASDFSFSPSQITVTKGDDVTIVLTASDIAHDFYVKGIGHIVHAKAGKTAKASIRFKKTGTYKFWCTIFGHKKQGMIGTITVT